MEQARKLFVYGSLMEGFFNYDKSLVGQLKSRAPAKTRGILYHQTEKGYPALIDGDGWVYGEIIELSDFSERIGPLDEIENYTSPGAPGNEYERVILPVLRGDGTAELCYCYRYARADLGSAGNPAVRVKSGDWRCYMQSACVC